MFVTLVGVDDVLDDPVPHDVGGTEQHELQPLDTAFQDVVRHKLVGRIVDAYEKYDSENGTENGSHKSRGHKGK